MVTFSRYDITKDGSQFYPEIISDSRFQADGVIYGHNDPWYWSVVDPNRHPLFVWKKSESSNYESSAESLGAVVFSNGPMMERFSPAQLLKRIGKGILTGIVAGGLSGAGVGALLASPGGVTLPVGAAIGGMSGAIGGAFTGGYQAYVSSLQNWIPLGPVYGTKLFVGDPGVPRPDPWLAHFGRSGVPFSKYVIALGANTQGLIEVIGGLIPLILNGVPMSSTLGATTYNPGYADLIKPTQRGIVAWALTTVPILEDAQYGLITAIGTRAEGVNGTLAGILLSIRASSAVAMDGSTSVMLGAGSDLLFDTLFGFFIKQRIQRYGFSCE